MAGGLSAPGVSGAMPNPELTHCVSALCSARAEVAFSFLADPLRLGVWALGCWGASAEPGGVVRGTSLFDGAPTYARAVPDRGHLTVDFEVGASPTDLVRRISSRVLPGGQLGRAPGVCVLILLAWRPATMDDERWGRLVASHEAEILLLRGRIEAEAAA